MKKLSTIAFLFITVLLASCGDGNKEKGSGVDTVKVVKDTVPQTSFNLSWETDTTLTTCESALNVPSQNGIFVSCINGDPTKKDNNGFISKVSADGKIEKLNWSQGKLSAPKGMGVLENALYVTDIDEFVKIDLTTGKILKKFKVPGSKFLNDVTVDTASKTVYFSDSEASVIYTLKNDKVEVWMKDSIQNPNGLLVKDGKLYVASFKGDFLVVNMADKKISKIASGIGGGDGVVYSSANNSFIVSNWYGEVFTIKPEGQLTKVLDTKDQKLSAADIDFIENQNLVLVPSFFGNKLMAYTVKW